MGDAWLALGTKPQEKTETLGTLESSCAVSSAQVI